MIPQIIIGATAGVELGFGWHKIVGCANRTCLLAGNPIISTIYGAAPGVQHASSVH